MKLGVMTNPLTISELRKELGMTQSAFAVAIGLSVGGKTSVSQIEAGQRPISLSAALRIEALSGGRIDAASLNDDVARARAACGGGCAVHDGVAIAAGAGASTGKPRETSREQAGCAA